MLPPVWMPTLRVSSFSSAMAVLATLVESFCAMPPKVGVRLLLRTNCTVGMSAAYRLTSRYWLARWAGLPALSKASTATL